MRYNTLLKKGVECSGVAGGWFRQVMIAWLFLFLSSCASGAYAMEREYAIKAAFLYNFLNYIEWPNLHNMSGRVKVRLCVVGKNPFDGALTALEKKVSAEWDLDVEYIATDYQSPAPVCHIAFISDLELEYATAVKSLSSSGVLTVSDIKGFARDMGIIEFAKYKDKIKLIINADRLEAADLKASSKLMRISEIVRSGD